jgi:hypothetical protein
VLVVVLENGCIWGKCYGTCIACVVYDIEIDFHIIIVGYFVIIRLILASK